jgi:O-acetyl-ADP-ribose deacetylase (regulator of RNase III)
LLNLYWYNENYLQNCMDKAATLNCPFAKIGFGQYQVYSPKILDYLQVRFYQTDEGLIASCECKGREVKFPEKLTRPPKLPRICWHIARALPHFREELAEEAQLANTRAGLKAEARAAKPSSEPQSRCQYCGVAFDLTDSLCNPCLNLLANASDHELVPLTRNPNLPVKKPLATFYTEIKGDIFDLTEEVNCLVNPVNTVGVMGKGLAREFAEKFPFMLPQYKEACQDGSLKIGRVQVIRYWAQSPASQEEKEKYLRYIANFPTKVHWKDQSRYEWVEVGLKALVQEAQNYHWTKIALPRLGCGLGGLEWAKVRAMILKAFEPTGIKVLLVSPDCTFQ